jgi:hypothetical protein
MISSLDDVTVIEIEYSVGTALTHKTAFDLIPPANIITAGSTEYRTINFNLCRYAQVRRAAFGALQSAIQLRSHGSLLF